MRNKKNRLLQIRYSRLRKENKRLKEKLANQNTLVEAQHDETAAEMLAKQVETTPQTDTVNKKTTGRSRRNKKFIIFSIAAVLLIGAFSAVLVYAFDNGLTIPDGGIRDVVTLQGNEVPPSAFLAVDQNGDILYDMAGIVPEFRYPQQVDFNSPGRQEVVLTLQEGRRTATVYAALYVLVPVDFVTMEAGAPPDSIIPLDFIANAHGVSASFNIQIVDNLTEYYARQVGDHRVVLSMNGIFFTSVVHVVDTTPPTATPVNIMIPMGQMPTVYDFVANVYDISPVVTIEFYHEPDFFAQGEQYVDIVLEDYFGNRAVYTATLNILPNEIPPRIYGAQDIFVQQSSPVMFRRGISAYDAFDRPIQFTVDSSEVDVDTLGVYTVIYHTVDAWGMTAEATANVYVIAVDPERVRAMADTILEGILRDGMTQVEQARAIFNWVGNNVAFAAHIRRPTLYENAYQALRNRQGNCFVYYALSEVMLTQAGIPNMQILRVGGTTNHTWNLINPDDLGWHHFDATPVRVAGINRFMFTNSQAREFTERIRRAGVQNYYVFDPDLYPEIVE